MGATRIRKHELGTDVFSTPGLTLGTTNSAGTTGVAVATDATILAFDATAPVNQASADTAAAGTATVAARRDHKHGMPTLATQAAGSTPALSLGTTNAAGTAATFIRDDDTILAFDATAPVDQASGDTAAAGTATVAARRDHKHGMPTIGAPGTIGITLGTANSAGTATTYVRTDATQLVFDATAPSTQAFGDSAAVGTAAIAARRDHKHAMMAAPPGANTFVYSEVPTGDYDGVDTTYSILHAPATGTLCVFKNGMRQLAGSGNDYTLTTTVITFETGNLPQTGDTVLVDYQYA